MDRLKSVHGLTVLVVLLSAGSLSGCWKLETRKAELHGESGCKHLVQNQLVTRGKAKRFFRYRAHVGIGEPLPNSVSVRSGGSARLRYVGRRVVNKRHDAGFSICSVFMVLQFVFLGLLLIGLVATALAFAGISGASQRRAILGGTLATLLLFAVSSYASGSVVAIDNISDSDLVVNVNGTDHKLPANRFVDLRISGLTFDIVTRSGGKTIEKLTLHPDDGIGDRLVRFLWGNGRYVYSVCALNRYFFGDEEYKKR